MNRIRGSDLMKPWTILRRETAFRNPILKVQQEVLVTPDGGETEWTVVELGDGVCVLPLGPTGFRMIRQYRPAVEEAVLEFPAGRREEGESVLDTARRELREEAGLEADRLTPLGWLWPLDGICRHRIHYVLAQNLSDVASAPEPFEDIVLETVERAELMRRLADGRLRDGVGAAGLSLLLAWEASGSESEAS
ncbi:MAG TPA: NUDIX hydrolase [Planctomycetes bacterium]|nr:NUDIX hydrolase [Planctomycetota bacterium]